jgi:hypothetical protein
MIKASTLTVALFIVAGSLALRAHDRPKPPPPPPGEAHGHDHIHTLVELTRPDPAVDEDAEGHVHLKEHKERSAIHIHVRHLTPGATYTAKITKDDATETLGEITVPVHEREPKPSRCFTAELTGDQEVPPVDTEAAGMAKFKIERRDRSVLRYEVQVEGLSGPAIAAHIHTGATGVPGDVLIPLDHEALRGEVEITPEQLAAIESGDTYVNVHTEANPDGEIRGQIAACPLPPPPPPKGNGRLKIDTKRGDALPFGATSLLDLVGAVVSIEDAEARTVLSGVIPSLERPEPPPPAPRCFAASLSGDQEVPPVDTEATGTARFNVERRDRSLLRYEVKVEGLSGPAIAAHIHAGATGVPGDVLIPLDHETLRGEVEITPEQLAAIESGDTYVNVHTEANPDGEIRGQIGVCPPRPPRGDSDDEGEGEAGAGAGHELSARDFFFDEFDFELEGDHDASFRRGDVNMDGSFNITDPVAALSMLFRGTPMPYCQDVLDAEDNGVLDISDPIAMLMSLFAGTGPLPPPGINGLAGFDPTADDILCNELRD